MLRSIKISPFPWMFRLEDSQWQHDIWVCTLGHGRLNGRFSKSRGFSASVSFLALPLFPFFGSYPLFHAGNIPKIPLLCLSLLPNPTKTLLRRLSLYMHPIRPMNSFSANFVFSWNLNKIILFKVQVHCCLNDLEAADYGEFVSMSWCLNVINCYMMIWKFQIYLKIAGWQAFQLAYCHKIWHFHKSQGLVAWNKIHKLYSVL